MALLLPHNHAWSVRDSWSIKLTFDERGSIRINEQMEQAMTLLLPKQLHSIHGLQPQMPQKSPIRIRSFTGFSP